MRGFHLFLSCQLVPSVHGWVHVVALVAVAGWFYFAFVAMGFWVRFFSAELILIDLLVGFPLVLALGAVIYGLVYWVLKWGVILLRPDWLVCDEQEDE